MQDTSSENEEENAAMPVTRTPGERDAALAPLTHEKEFPPSRIVIADDDGEMREMLRRALARERHHVAVAKDGSELLDLLANSYSGGEEPYDLIILDVRMPGWNGIQLLAGLRGSEAPPVIVITAFGDATLHRKAQSLGAAATLDKPFDIELLRSIVRCVLTEWEPSRAARPLARSPARDR